MPQSQQKSAFPGFGVVFPGGGQRGIKVVRTFTQGSIRMVQPDGSVSFSTPPPTIHELFGGGFCYADGSPVTDRAHLENITDKGMKERALKWYDAHGRAIAPEDVVVREEKEEKERPEPDYILSNQVPPEVLEEGKSVAETKTQDPLNAILQAINNLGERITKLESIPEERKRAEGDKRKKQSEAMREKWKDPEYIRKYREAKGYKPLEEVNHERVPDSNPDEGHSTR